MSTPPPHDTAPDETAGHDAEPTPPPMAAPRISRNLRGMLFMLLATASVATLQGVIRRVAADLHPYEIVFFRNTFGLLLLLPWVGVQWGARPLYTRRWGLHLLRGVLNLAAMLAWFEALTLISLAQVAALSFSAPLYATILAILILGERAYMRRLVALAAGFVGMLLIIRPGMVPLNTGTLLMIGNTVTWAGSLIVIKYLTRTESSLTITTYMGVFMAPMSLVPALFVWQWPTWEQLAWCALIGALGTTSQLGVSQAFREADATLVLPLDFAKLLWVSLIGYVFFSEIPDPWTWVGGATIFASTTYLAIRDARAPAR